MTTNTLRYPLVHGGVSCRSASSFKVKARCGLGSTYVVVQISVTAEKSMRIFVRVKCIRRCKARHCKAV